MVRLKLLFLLFLLSVSGMVPELEVTHLRDMSRAAFLHAYDSYMSHGFPFDELQPLSCKPRRYDQKTRGTLDDVLGGYMLTLVDSLDGLLVLGEYERFNTALLYLAKLNFNRDIEVSVFEVNIRLIGGLLSAHQLALRLYPLVAYDGVQLLDLAESLANRLLPAFQTPTGIPEYLVNLRHGKIRRTSRDRSLTCPAAGGTFLLEFSLLSRLTGDPRFELAASRALYAIWRRRSPLHLLGSTIDTASGHWVHTHSSIGAGIDSYFETLLKSYVLLGDLSLLQAFDVAYSAVQKHVLRQGWYIEVDMHRGEDGPPYSLYISSLQAFWPSLQVLAGHVSEAETSFAHLEYLWRRYRALPDIYDLSRNGTLSYAQDYPLRPEMIESAYHLYLATRKEEYVEFARDFLMALEDCCRVPCGYASLADVNTGRLDDRMDSYLLAETLKYLYLLFNEALPSSQQSSSFCNHDATISTAATSNSSAPISLPCIPYRSTLFSTEGHVFIVEASWRHVPRTIDKSSVSSDNDTMYPICDAIIS